MVEMKPTFDPCSNRPLQEQRSVAPLYLIGGKTDPCSTEDKGHLRIILDHQTSKALTATGEAAFMVIGRASHPDDPSRWVLHLVPVPMATAAAACNVALGTHRAVRTKSDTTPKV